MSKLDFADLTDTHFIFKLDYAFNNKAYWDYDFSAEIHDTKYFRSMTMDEIDQLRGNCKRILQAIEKLQGGN